MMVPALADAHEAHKARQARMAGKPYVPPVMPAEPLRPRKPAPPLTSVRVPLPVEVGSTRKHQIMALSAAGYSQGKIALRLDLTKNQVAGVLYRARTIVHKVLLGEVVLAMFHLGFDTYDIAVTIGEPEHVIGKELARARDRERGL